MKRLRDIDMNEEPDWWETEENRKMCECMACQPDLDDRHEVCEEWCFMGAVPVESDGTRMPVHVYENLNKYEYNPETKQYDSLEGGLLMSNRPSRWKETLTPEEEMDEMLNEATGVPHYEVIIDSIRDYFDGHDDGGNLVPQDILLNAIRYYGEALEKALKQNEAFIQALIDANQIIRDIEEEYR